MSYTITVPATVITSSVKITLNDKDSTAVSKIVSTCKLNKVMSCVSSLKDAHQEGDAAVEVFHLDASLVEFVLAILIMFENFKVQLSWLYNHVHVHGHIVLTSF